MNYLFKAALLMSALLSLVGLGAAVCGNCNYPGGPWVEGTSVHLQGPDNSGSQARPLDYEWVLYKCDGTPEGVMATFNHVSGGTTSRDLYFYAPPEGDYRIALTVKDKNTAVAVLCYDIRDICFSTTSSTCPTLCCGEVCEEDAADYTKCPWHMQYDGLVVPGWEYRWYVKQGATTVYSETDTSATADGVQLNVDWGTGYAVGDYQVSFEIWAPDPTSSTGALAEQLVCTASCTCGSVPDGVTALTPCTVRVVEKPDATIGIIP